VIVWSLLVGCRATEPAAEVPEGCVDPGTEGATASCLQPTRDPEHYIAEALAYFDTLDVDADRDSTPDYHPQVARWEWPPWLLLTGFTAETMVATSDLLRQLDPSTVPERDCRAFDVQPFARCYVVFEYEDGPCPIYEEFTFDGDGRTTFIEAWSDVPGLLPHTDPDDPWAERHDIGRLATRVPGLGNTTGSIDLDSSWMREASERDGDVAELAKRAEDQWTFWLEEYTSADEDFFAVGCGW
jgi:hypothetical protein